MRRTAFLLLAAASLAGAARRPHYGGTLRLEMQAAVRALDPQAPEAEEKLLSLVFEPLLRLDAQGRPQPDLAVSWQRDASGRRWQFRLRGGVKFHDGSPLTPAAAAAALSGSGWQTALAADGISVSSEQALDAADFADIRRSIVLRTADGVIGTGPFRLAQFEPGRRAVFSAVEEHWEGRPFLDAVTVEMGRAPHDQMLDLELGKADFIELWPNELRRAQQDNVKLWSSAPVVLLALVFERVEDARVREALALSIDRGAICSVLLQKRGEPAGSILPQWLSGWAFLFPATRDPARGRQLAAAAALQTPLLLGFDPGDPLARPLAERIAVNAREVGIKVVATPQRGDLRLARVRVPTGDAGSALAGAAAALRAGNLPAPAGGPEAVYAAERTLLEDFRVVPLVHLPEMYGSRPAVKAWITPGVLPSGAWRLEDLWISAERP